jgi:predicted DNA-binding WGR domain protein
MVRYPADLLVANNLQTSDFSFFHPSRSGSMKRRFEFVGGSSAKFWEVTVGKAAVTVCFGRLGTSGQSQTKSFDNAAAAQKHADKLIQEKLGKGYVECQTA